MSRFTEGVKNVVKNIAALAIDKYEHAKIITTSLGYAGFTYVRHAIYKLIKHGYASNTDVYSIVSKIIRTGANIPIKITKTLPNGDVEDVTEGMFFDFVQKPDGVNNWIEWTENCLGYQLTSGNEILYGLKPAGFPFYSKVHLMPTQLMDIKKRNNDFFSTEYKYVLKYKGKQETLDQEDIKHIKYFNPTEQGYEHNMGLSPLQAGYQTVESSNEVQAASANAIKNRGANGLLSSEGDKPMGKEEKKDLQETVKDELGGGTKFNQIVATSAKVKYTPFGLSPADLKMLENDVLSLRKLCNMYGIDSSMFNDPANKKYNNLREALKALYINAVLPVAERHLRGFKDMVLPGWNLSDGVVYNIEYDTSGIEALQEDQNKVVTKQVALSKGMTDIIMRVGEGKIKPKSAIKLLMKSFDLSENEATELVADTGEATETNTDTNE